VKWRILKVRSRLLSGLPERCFPLNLSLGLVAQESFMFARKVSMHLKADRGGDFIKKMENEVIPLLRLQHGFLDEITLISQSGKEVYAYSFWENSADAERYDKNVFAQVTNLLAGIIDGTLRIHTYMVANSTFHKMAAAIAS
jgi:hypothetical protein